MEKHLEGHPSVLELTERDGLDLPDALAGESEDLTALLQGHASAIGKVEDARRDGAVVAHVEAAVTPTTRPRHFRAVGAGDRAFLLSGDLLDHWLDRHHDDQVHRQEEDERLGSSIGRALD